MKKTELIVKLQEIEGDPEVIYIYDGAGYGIIQHVFVSKDGNIKLADERETIYHDEDRPVGSITEKQDRYFQLK